MVTARMAGDVVWSELQQIILGTLMARREQLREAGDDDQQADFLSDHIADDVYARFTLTRRRS